MHQANVLPTGDQTATLHVRHVTFTPPTSTDFLLPHFPLTVAVHLTSPLPDAALTATVELERADGYRQSTALDELKRQEAEVVLRGAILPREPGSYRYRVMLRAPQREICVSEGDLTIVEPRSHERWTQGPMITEIDEHLFLGNVAAAANPRLPGSQRGLLENHGIKALLNATDDRDPSPALRATGIAYIQFPFVDFSHNPMDETRLWGAVQWIDGHIRQGNPVFVHCHAGIGRSGSLVVAYLMLCRYPEQSFDAVVDMVNARLRHQQHAIYPHLDLPETIDRLRERVATGNARMFAQREPVGEVLSVAFAGLYQEGHASYGKPVAVGDHVELRQGIPSQLRVAVEYVGAPPRGVYLYTNLNRDAPTYERILMQSVEPGIYQAELVPRGSGEDFWITALATPRQYDHDLKARRAGGNLQVRVVGAPATEAEDMEKTI